MDHGVSDQGAAGESEEHLDEGFEVVGGGGFADEEEDCCGEEAD